jgi:adenosine deaminase
MSLATFIEAMPKVELHVHLEGAMIESSLLNAASRNEIDTSLRHFQDWVQQFRAAEVKRIWDNLRMFSSWLRHPDDLTRAIYDVGVLMHRQNVVYAEVGISPVLLESIPMTAEEFFNAVNDGRDRVRRAWGVELAWVLFVSRDEARRAEDIARWAMSPTGRKGFVIALGLTGQEDKGQVASFERSFGNASKKEVPLVVRAGDVQSGEGILAAIETLHPQRLLDARGLLNHEAALNAVRTRNIPVCFSISRAVRHGWVASPDAYPLRALLEAGVQVVLVSDLPNVYHNTLNDEYRLAVEACGLSVDELCDVALNAVRYSYLPDARKAALIEEFNGTYERLRAEHLSEETA